MAPQCAYKQYGSGERVFVGLHGWNGNHHSFDALVPYLPSDVTLIVFDLPGYGRSTAPQSWNMMDVIGALQQQLLDLRLPPFSMIGNCSGGLLGMWSLRDIPSLPVQRIVLIDTFGFMPGYFQIFLWPFLGPFFYYATFANPVGRWLTNRSLRQISAQRSDLTQSFAQSSPHIPFRYLRLFQEMGDYRSFRHIQVPVDLLYGEHTFRAVKDSIALWQTVFSSTAVYPLAGAGHLSVQETPALVAQIVFGSQT